MLKNRKIVENTTKDVRIDTGLHTLLKLKATRAGMSIKTLLEGYIADVLKDETSGN